LLRHRTLPSPRWVRARQQWVDLAEIQRLFAIERRRRSLVFGRLF
jgi:hypothetical protein